MSEVVIEVDIPEDAVAVGTIAVVQWMDAEGEMNFAMEIDGDLTYLGLAGLLSGAQHRLWAEWEALQDDDPE